MKIQKTKFFFFFFWGGGGGGSLKREGRLIQSQIIVKIVGRVSKWSLKTGGRSIRVVVSTILTVCSC